MLGVLTPLYMSNRLRAIRHGAEPLTKMFSRVSRIYSDVSIWYIARSQYIENWASCVSRFQEKNDNMLS
jgi:hypothetical protein